MASSRAATAKHEIAAITDMYNRMLKQCFEKCVEHFHDSELSLGENTCIDRCVMKYGECQVKVGETMAKVTSQMNPQQAGRP
jgi:import inner membrane translocase subunit TIM10